MVCRTRSVRAASWLLVASILATPVFRSERVCADDFSTIKSLTREQARNLRRLSPRTLTALIEKDDVEIPLIEIQGMIPEPDGSPTEDGVVPENFLSRQREQRKRQEQQSRGRSRPTSET